MYLLGISKIWVPLTAVLMLDKLVDNLKELRRERSQMPMKAEFDRQNSKAVVIDDGRANVCHQM